MVLQGERRKSDGDTLGQSGPVVGSDHRQTPRGCGTGLNMAHAQRGWILATDGGEEKDEMEAYEGEVHLLEGHSGFIHLIGGGSSRPGR